MLLENFDGKFTVFLEKNQFPADQLQAKIVEAFNPVFNDEWVYQNKLVKFNKRSQAVIESLHSIFEGNAPGNIPNIETLTALADYIIPNLLRNNGIIVYSDTLTDLIDRQIELQAGSEYEVEIRANTIWSVELVRQELLKLGKG